MYLKMGSYLSGNFLKGPKCDENETKNCVIIKKKDGNLDVCSLRTQVTAHCGMIPQELPVHQVTAHCGDDSSDTVCHQEVITPQWM